MFEWLWSCLVTASPAMVMVGLCTLLMTNPKKKVYYRGVVVGSLLSGLSILFLFGGMGLLGWTFGNGSLWSALGYLLLIVAPVLSVIYGLSTLVGAFIFSATLSENVGVGKRVSRAVIGAFVGVNIATGVSGWVLSLLFHSPGYGSQSTGFAFF